MIECEYYCIKHEGKAANVRIRIKNDNTELNICYSCLNAWFKPNEYEILEDYNPYPRNHILYNKDHTFLQEKLQRIQEAK